LIGKQTIYKSLARVSPKEGCQTELVTAHDMGARKKPKKNSAKELKKKTRWGSKKSKNNAINMSTKGESPERKRVNKVCRKLF